MDILGKACRLGFCASTYSTCPRILSSIVSAGFLTDEPNVRTYPAKYTKPDGLTYVLGVLRCPKTYMHLESWKSPEEIPTERFYHDTHIRCVPNILSEGYLWPSNDPNLHEFSKPGIYASRQLAAALYGTELVSGHPRRNMTRMTTSVPMCSVSLKDGQSTILHQRPGNLGNSRTACFPSRRIFS